jgi:hypothetical protein
MRLYRGLKGPYRPDEVRSRVKDKGNGTDFTDCPFTALSYAGGRKGVVLVLDVPDDVGPSVTEETWFVDAAKRLMVWGTFDRWLAAAIPAKDLRSEVRKRGIAGLLPTGKSEVLKSAIARRLAGRHGLHQQGDMLRQPASGELAISSDSQGA